MFVVTVTVVGVGVGVVVVVVGVVVVDVTVIPEAFFNLSFDICSWISLVVIGCPKMSLFGECRYSLLIVAVVSLIVCRCDRTMVSFLW